MNELWVKKTIFRRYLIDDSDIEEVKIILEHDQQRAEHLIDNYLNENKEIEYDQEEMVFPIDFSINKLEK
jgi:hypothetical protein